MCCPLSFTWLSWQVHRSVAVLIKGSSVTPFRHEFRRLYSSSEPVAGFVTSITLPQTLSLDSTSREAQDNHSVISKKTSTQTKMMSLWAWNEEAENTVLCIPQSTEFDGSGVQEPNPMYAASPTYGQHKAVCYQSALKKNSNRDHTDVGSERLFPQQIQSLVTKPLGLVSGLNTQRDQWNYSLNYQPQVRLPSGIPNLLYPSTQQQTQPTTSHQFHFTSSRGHTSGLQTKIFNAMGTHLKPHLQADSKRFLPDGRAKMQPQNAPYQQHNCPPRLNWTPQSHPATGPRAVAHYNSFSGTNVTGQLGWRTLQNSTNTLLGRSRSMTDRDAAGLHPNRTHT